MDNLEKQGDKLFKSGKKELKTGLFKWKPDYDAAVSKFEEATKFFKNAQKWEKALESLEKQVFCCKQTVDDWGVARGLESIVQIQCDHPEIIKDETKLNDQAKEAAQYFKVSQSYTNLIKLYKLVSNFYIETRHDRKKALDFAKQAYEDSLESDQSYNVTEIIDFYIDLLCQNEMYVDAIKVYRQQTELLKNTDSKTPLEQYALLSIGLCLVLNDSIQANKELEYYICE
ncbi:hypothetical protein PPERSA_05768 [Pseudocohnilembus persalinus]|uniref:Gamma-soluble NSF attachment protein n=1 Tax=Pseudocohnilembus persalinus TaxID=266149 RepID=A0A0V0QI36_PSEPJ|nr:hypothetical protein PPERSA_05768 [Pseudocohnilembus persalinus]|eukprot:KRX01929.1 hypothetical protein PPERSA_05768 [Pseudocohnilembus persalinus]